MAASGRRLSIGKEKESRCIYDANQSISRIPFQSNMCGDPDKIMISSMDVNRPGLELNRFFDYYDTSRIVIFGNAETAFLASMDPAERAKVLDELFSQKPPAAIIARGLEPAPELLEATKRNDVRC